MLHNWPKMEFDYVVLDEAQAVKNAATASAKAVRLLRGSSSPGAQRHAGGEPSGRIVEPVRVSESRHAGRGQGAQDGRRPGAQSRRGCPPHPRPGPAAVHSAAHQTAGGARAAGEDRTDHLLRTRGPAAETVRRIAQALPRDAAGARAIAGHGKIEDARAGGAAAPAPGGLPSRPARHQALRRTQRQAGRPDGSVGGTARGRPQSAGLFAVHQPAGHRALAPG